MSFLNWKLSLNSLNMILVGVRVIIRVIKTLYSFDNILQK